MNAVLSTTPDAGRPAVPCLCCGGTGTFPLREDLWQTLQRLSFTEARRTDELVEAGRTRNAINNRLVALEKLGLVTRSGKTGKWVHWLRINP